ncbi:hypothetical protein R3P38DRAFT_3177167 [Favolaschia claudopus]|uniref:Maturase K n=1 Tax=Favolaschia claudopus TaxID=2862362 RepID=A0AAW0CYF2_9AGAR
MVLGCSNSPNPLSPLYLLHGLPDLALLKRHIDFQATNSFTGILWYSQVLYLGNSQRLQRTYKRLTVPGAVVLNVVKSSARPFTLESTLMTRHLFLPHRLHAYPENLLPPTCRPSTSSRLLGLPQQRDLLIFFLRDLTPHDHDNNSDPVRLARLQHLLHTSYNTSTAPSTESAFQCRCYQPSWPCYKDILFIAPIDRRLRQRLRDSVFHFFFESSAISGQHLDSLLYSSSFSPVQNRQHFFKVFRPAM